MRTLTTTRRRPVDEPLFGRAAEVDVVDQWLELAAEGRARIGMIRGTPGVGKTRFLDAIADRAHDRDVLVLRGVGSPDAPPLLPLLTCLVPLIDAARAGRRPDLGPDDLDALDAMTHLGVASAEDDPEHRRADDTARYLAASRLLLGAARSRAVLLVIDDAHDLDDASASLLAHLTAAAEHLTGAVPVRLLTLLGVRSTVRRPVTRRILGRLREERGEAELTLGGLDELDLNALLTARGPAPPSRPLLRAINHQTLGNPLYARLIWDHLLDRSAATVHPGQVTLEDPAATDLAHLGLDDVLDDSIEGLPPACRALLGVAALLGDEGEVTTLAAATDRSVSEVESLLTVAEGAGVCRLNVDRYQFDHPLRRAALSRASARGPRRQRHLRLAEALAAESTPSALQVAAHLRSAGPLASAPDRRRWGVAAAEEALDRGAWGDAVSGFSLALDDGVAAGFSPDRRLALHTAATSAAAADHDLVSCEHFGREAISLARQAQHLEAWCRAVTDLGHARVRVAAGGTQAPTEELESFLDAAGSEAPRLRARALAMLGELRFAAFDFDAGLRHLHEARRLAIGAGDAAEVAFVQFVAGLHHQGRFDLDASDLCFAESIAVGPDEDVPARAWSRARLPSTLWLRGDLSAADRAATAAEIDAGDRLDWAELSLVTAWRAAIAGATGAFGDAEAFAEHALTLHRRCDYAFAPIVAEPPLAIARAMQGNVDGAHRGLERWRGTASGRWVDEVALLVDALAGDLDRVRAALSEVPWRVRRPATTDIRRAGSLLVQVEVGCALGDDAMVAAAGPALEWLHARGVRFVPGSLSLVSRLAAAAAAADGDPAAARRWLGVARHDGRHAGAAAELARCDLDEAVLSHREHGRSEDIDHLLTSAASAFDSLRMLPFLRRAEGLLGMLGTGGGRRARKVILFTDLVDSTSLNAAAGDDAYLQLLRVHDRVVRDALARHDGVEFKHTGDGVGSWFSSPRHAVRCALELQETLSSVVRTDSGRAVQVRCGLAAGEPIADSGDLFGLAVARAARICAAAEAGTVLLSEELVPMVAGSGAELVDTGPVRLKGLPGSVHVYLARPVAL